MNVNTFTP